MLLTSDINLNTMNIEIYERKPGSRYKMLILFFLEKYRGSAGSNSLNMWLIILKVIYIMLKWCNNPTLSEAQSLRMMTNHNKQLPV